MKRSTGISKMEILEYLRLEEDEDTAERLKASSLLHVGAVVTDGVKVHYWSYPTPCDVAWVSFSSDGALGTVNEDEVPHTIKAATAPREEHPIRQAAELDNTPVDRAPISKPTWIPDKHSPRSIFYFPMYEDGVSIDRAARAFSARTKRVDLGIDNWHVYFCVKLTSGRYALVQARETTPGQISIELEVEDSGKDYPMGYVHVSDLKEILSVLGRECELPLKNCQYHWRD